MATLLVSQPHFADHKTPEGHPERAERIGAVNQVLTADAFSGLDRQDAVPGDLQLASLVHDASVLRHLQDLRPAEGIRQIDPDTHISSGSLGAAAECLGGAILALESVMSGQNGNAFCAARPPGHHAERRRSMGFCLINTIAVLARYAQQTFGVERVAIVDFDVHHGNGTQDIFEADPSVLYASSHQMPLYPGTGAPSETGVGNIVNVALDPDTGSDEMREAYTELILPALANFGADLVLISAGFDAHQRDPLANLMWHGTDFAWVTGKIMDVAERTSNGRIVSLLEGGYDLTGLADGVSQHVHMLHRGTSAPNPTRSSDG